MLPSYSGTPLDTKKYQKRREYLSKLVLTKLLITLVFLWITII
jgi:hypothetical protein